jgi:hypothetical protein
MGDPQKLWRYKMQVLRKIVKRESIKSIFIPEEFGDKVELIVLSLEQGKTLAADSEAVMKLQEKTGFAMNVLASEKEDVWNDI